MATICRCAKLKSISLTKRFQKVLSIIAQKLQLLKAGSATFKSVKQKRKEVFIIQMPNGITNSDLGPDPPYDLEADKIDLIHNRVADLHDLHSLGRLFASLGGDQRGNYPRLHLVLALIDSGGSSTVNKLAASVNLTGSATSQHLKRLENDGIIEGKRVGVTTVYTLDTGCLAELIRLMRKLLPSLFIESVSNADNDPLTNQQET